MAISMKMVASELLMCGLKKVPYVGTALEVVEGVRSRHEMLAHADRIREAETKLSRMETGLRELVKNEIRTCLNNLGRPSLDGPTLTNEIRNLQAIRAQGWEPTLFEGLLANSSHWQELRRNPQNYGRVLSESELVNRDSIHVLIDADSTRVLELTPYALSQLLAGQALGTPKAEVVAPHDVWAMPAEHRIINTTLEDRIGLFVSSVDEKYVRNEKVTWECVEYIEERYIPAVVALPMDKRSKLLLHLESSWRPHKGRTNTNPIRSWGRVIMGVADYLLRPVTTEQVDWLNAADIIVRLARWYYTQGSQFQQRKPTIKTVVETIWGDIERLHIMYGRGQ